MNFDMNLVVNSFPLLLIGAGVTIQITVLSTAIGFVIGLVVGVARISHLRPLRLLAEVYVEFFRGTPLLVQLFLFLRDNASIRSSRRSPPAASTPARMWRRFFVREFSPWMRGRWRPVVRSV